MVKSVVLEIPTYLVHDDLYTKNKAIISDNLLAYLGLMPGSKWAYLVLEGNGFYFERNWIYFLSFFWN